MITIAQIKAFANRCIDNVDKLVYYEWVTTESGLSKKVANLKANQFPLLVVVTPSYDSDVVDRDSYWDVAQMLVFVLMRDKFQGANETNQADDMDTTLEIIGDIKYYLMAGFPDADQECVFHNGIVPSSFHIDPEYNYLGCNGWSMSFQIRS